MARKLKSDKILFLATLFLVGVSVVMVYSASAMLAQEKHLQPYHFASRQIAWSIIGLFLLWVTMRVDYRSYRQPVSSGPRSAWCRSRWSPCSLPGR